MSGEDLNLPSKERRINGRRYRATILPLVEWYPLEETALDAFGDPLRDLFAEFPMAAGAFDLGALRTEKIAEILHGILRGLGSQRLQTLVDSMAGAVEVHGKDGWRSLGEGGVNGHFRRYMRDLIPVILLHLEVQFADFFGGALDALPKRDLPKRNGTEPSSLDVDQDYAKSPFPLD